MRDMQRKHFKLHDCHSLTIDYNGENKTNKQALCFDDSVCTVRDNEVFELNPLSVFLV